MRKIMRLGLLFLGKKTFWDLNLERYKLSRKIISKRNLHNVEIIV